MSFEFLLLKIVSSFGSGKLFYQIFQFLGLILFFVMNFDGFLVGYEQFLALLSFMPQCNLIA